MSVKNAENSIFDWETYYNTYKKIIISDLGIDTKSMDIADYHWKYYGEKNNLHYFEVSQPIKNSYVNLYDENSEYTIFDVEQYLLLYPDLQDNITTKYDGWQHWINYGKNEGRKWRSLEKEEEDNEKVIDKEEWLTEIHEILENTDINKEYKIFDWVTYVNNYYDLSHFSNKMDAWNHWIKNGKNENRSFLKIENDEEYINFDWEKYINEYNDLKILKTKESAWQHWIKYGKIESRIYFSTKKLIQKTKEQYSNILPMQHYLSYENNFNQEYNNFDWLTYVSNYDDIGEIRNKEDAFEHWFFQGKEEGRSYSDIMEIDKRNNKIMKIEMKILSNKIVNENVIIVNSEKEVKEEVEEKVEVEEVEEEKEKVEVKVEEEKVKEEVEEKVEVKEKAKEKAKEKETVIKKDIAYHKNIMKKTLELKQLYENEMDKFMNEYKITDKKSIYADPKIEFRYFCFKYLNYTRYCVLPEIELYRSKDAVLIEFREFAHIEFLIRNAIMQLGSTWSFTVICGDDNYNFMTSICENISKNIKIIKLDIESPVDYNKLLKTRNFWDSIKGDKILLYQENSFIFSNNIDDFMEYDYIGAPRYENIFNINVGLSLRTRQIMIDIIDAVKEDIPEDTYFLKNIQRLQIRNIPDWDISSKFSSEAIYNKDSFAGHQFWISDPYWKVRMYNCLFSLKP